MRFLFFLLGVIGVNLCVGGTYFEQKEASMLPIQTNREIIFHIDEMPKDESILLEFDARIDFPPGIGGYNATALLVFVNQKFVPVESYLNCPMEFRFATGHTGEPGRWSAPRWNYDAVKTGDLYGDLMLKHGANHFSLVYARDFECIDGPRCAYRSPGISRSHFVLDITSLCRKGDNVLAFRNTILPHHVKMMGGSLTDPKNPKGKLPLVFRDITVRTTKDKARREEPFFLKELAEISASMPTVEPRTVGPEEFTLTAEPGGAVVLNVGKNRYVLSTTFSYPGSGRKNGIPATKVQEPGWKFQQDGLHCSGAGAFYKVDRKISRFPYHVAIEDTLENVTDQPVPVMVRYEIPFRFVPGETTVWHSGLKVTEPVTTASAFPENPTLFIQSPAGSIGMTPADDILRIHARNFVTPNTIQVRDEQLLLSPGKCVTLRLELFPLASGDYCDFIHHLRSAWDLNGATVNGSFRNAIAKPAPNWKPQKGLGHIHVNSNYEGRCRWGLQIAENKGLHEQMKSIIAAYKAILPPDIKVFSNYMALYFSNADGKDLERFKECVVVNRNGSYPTEDGCRFYIPTRENDFGKMIIKTIDMMLDDWKADGIYFDYLEGADPIYTYNQKDGVSCDIDPATGKLIAEKGCYQLLSKDFLLYLMKHIHEKGALIHANRSPFLTSTQKALKKETPFRWAECGYPDQLTRGHLAYCPLGLQRTFANQLHLQVVRALYEGMLTSPYDVRYLWEENPVAYFYPFTYREMRRGCAIGDNKIITAVSGYFGWGDQGGFQCRIFDRTGKLKTEQGGEIVAKDGKNYLKVVLEPMEVAVIDRVRK